MAASWQKLISNPPVPADPAERQRTMRALNLIAILAIADAILLGFLVAASLADDHGTISILGPIHGIGFVVLLGLCVNGAATDRWGWWFPALVVVTLGPLGSLIGDVILRRRLRAVEATA